METILAFCIGITLSAACGFRVFIPPFIMSLGSIYGDFPLTGGFEWLGTYPAAIALGAATTVEILAYYLPVVDNFLDSIEIPFTIAIGTMLTAASLGEVSPLLKWSLAVIAGGGTAGIVESFTVITRLATTGLTAGLGNSLFSTTEAISATTLSILALTIPLLAAIVVLVVLVLAAKKLLKYFKQKKNNFQMKIR